MPRDIIRVNELLATASVSNGARWPPKTPKKSTAQPVLITVAIPHDVRATATTDDLDNSINYSSISSLIRTSVSFPDSTFASIEHLARHIFNVLLSGSQATPPFSEASLKIVQIKAPLHCKSVSVEADLVSAKLVRVQQSIQDLECDAIIGVNPSERLEKQLVRFNITIQNDDSDLGSPYWLDFRALSRRLYENIGKSSYLTLEALVSFAALETLDVLSKSYPIGDTPRVIVRAAKPCALVFAESAEVEICRTFEDYPDHFSAKAASPPNSTHKVAIALGSNLGDRFCNIESALQLLETPKDLLEAGECPEGLDYDTIFVAVIDTSFIYESSPMYVTDQPNFINCACLVETNLPPLDLLALVKKIESRVGRVPSIRNGPRAVDLDIVLYDSDVIDSRTSPDQSLDGQLVVPHPRMSEREFVLRPLCDMIPEHPHPTFRKPIRGLLEALLKSSTDSPLKRVIPFPRNPTSDVSSSQTYWTLFGKNAKTRLMATLNATPDSFSDGSLHNSVSTALAYAQTSVEAGASIIDVGGYSTRPGAAFISVQEEIQRVVPVIQALRKDPVTSDIPISIDTFRPEVAKAAILAGANCINDVYAFTGPESYPYSSDNPASQNILGEMKTIAREFAVPVILMHSRGDAGKNKEYEHSVDSQAAVIEAIKSELGIKVDAIVKGRGGLRRWFVIVDPGVGFSKTVDGNLQVLTHSSDLTADGISNPLSGYPILIGTSRKSFLGKILEKESGKLKDAAERDWATSAAVACAVQQGAAIVRIHNVQAMADVVHIADALWRP
ncbi:Dihydropteroate synthase-like protein [Mycena floridula]|nr:Dihydropteroate synthase-like protein [Mycena floridula]